MASGGLGTADPEKTRWLSVLILFFFLQIFLDIFFIYSVLSLTSTMNG